MKKFTKHKNFKQGLIKVLNLWFHSAHQTWPQRFQTHSTTSRSPASEQKITHVEANGRRLFFVLNVYAYIYILHGENM